MTTPETNGGAPGTVIITGGTKGIGLATASKFATAGHSLLLSYRRDAVSARAAADRLKGLGVNVSLVACDLSDDAAPLLEAIEALTGPVGTLVIGAAASAFRPLEEIRAHHIERTLRLTIGSTIAIVNATVPRFSEHGSIVTVSGGDSVRFIPGHGLLGAAKSGLEVLTKYLSVELASKRIRANCVLPGPVATESARTWAGEHYEEFADRAARSTPGARIGTPDDIAKVIYLLSTPDAEWISGQVIVADGGLLFADAVFGRSS